jgi:hypothetical protein
MPSAMLRYLASRPGPTVLTDPDDIVRVRLLRSIELVEAHIPACVTAKDGRVRYTGAAVVHCVTTAGRKIASRAASFPDGSAGPESGSMVMANEHWQTGGAGKPSGNENRAV